MNYIPLNELYYKDNSHWKAEYISRYNNQFVKHLTTYSINAYVFPEDGETLFKVAERK